MNSSRELYQHQISIEKTELESMPEEESEELALIYEAKGLDDASAKNLSSQTISNQSKALDTLAREELGIDPDSLGGSAWQAGSRYVLLALHYRRDCPGHPICPLFRYCRGCPRRDCEFGDALRHRCRGHSIYGAAGPPDRS